MKKIVVIQVVCIVSYVFSFAMPAFSQAQGESQSSGIQKFIVDPKIRHGQLENGLTYYIRHNEMPKERAEFYIVHNVGSMQEEYNQRGLAHFLEHIAFSGSKNFPSKNGIQEYIESLGMRMGENVNAYTGFDETVYMLMNAPVTREGIVDSCLLILHDWSSYLLLDEEAIEKERSIIREEWRTNQTAQMRLWEQQLPKMYPGNRYGERLPIGSIGVIESFKRQELEAYYKKWYRPDLQAIIIVGDVDVDQVERKIKTLFSAIPKPVNPAPKELFLVSDNDRPLVSIAKDKEMTNMILTFYYKHDQIPFQFKGTIAELITDYEHAVISLVMQERFAEIIQHANAPFLSAYANDGDYFVSKTKGAWTSAAYVKPGELERAMVALVGETERVKKFGFTQAEYDRARENILAAYESYYNERDNQENSTIAQRCFSHFTYGEYMPGIEIENELIKNIAPNYPLEGINHAVSNLFREGDNRFNLVISLVGPDQANIMYPTEQELLAMFLMASYEPVEANDEEVISRILIPELPKPGKIVSEQEDPIFGATVYTLSNGLRVVVKQTAYKNDEILMRAESPGGTSMFKDEKDIWNLKMVNAAVMRGGLGDFSENNFLKAIAGKNVDFQAGLGFSNELLYGSASPSDLKTLFEIIYLRFTGIRTDEEAFTAFKEHEKIRLEYMPLDPRTHFSDTLAVWAYDNNPRSNRLKPEDFDKINYHRMIEMYKERFADASDFVFTFVGNVDKDSIRPLMEQYLATLPALNRKDVADENQISSYHKGKVKNHFSKILETPVSSIGLMYNGEMPYHLKNCVIAELLSQILDLAYMGRIREEEGASYVVYVSVDLFDFPKGRTSLQIFFETDPQKQDKMIEATKSVLEQIANEGPSEAYFNRSVEMTLRGRPEKMQENDYWLNGISTYFSRNFNAHTEYENVLKSITAEDIKAFTKALLDQGNEVEVVMFPAETNE